MHLPESPGGAKHAAVTTLSTGECSTQNGWALLVSSQARDKNFTEHVTEPGKTAKLINMKALRVVKPIGRVKIF